MAFHLPVSFHNWNNVPATNLYSFSFTGATKHFYILLGFFSLCVRIVLIALYISCMQVRQEIAISV